MSECLGSRVADCGHVKDVSFQIDTMDTSLFDALICAAVLHDHYVYVAQTSMAKLTIHAVTNRVLTYPLTPSSPHQDNGPCRTPTGLVNPTAPAQDCFLDIA